MIDDFADPEFFPGKLKIHVNTKKYQKALWIVNKSRKFLSSANPFQFRDFGSTDPVIYAEF